MTLDADSPLWQGVEIEYAIASDCPSGAAVGPNEFFEALRTATVGGVPACIFASDQSAFLASGGKAYVDRVISSEVLELCTPECGDAKTAATHERALDTYVRVAHSLLTEAGKQPPHVYRASMARNFWGRPNTRGLHESYLIRSSSFRRCLRVLTPFLVLRSLFFGSGGYVQGRFVTSPRQFFVKAVASRRVPRDHPFVALGKKSHAGIGWARFHVCNGEATRADVSTFLRQAVTSWLVRCADLGILEHVPSLTGPIEQARRLAGPPERPWALELTDGRRLSAIEYFRTYYLPAITQLVAGRGAVDREALSLFIRVLERLEMRDFASLSRTLDWCIKYDIFEMHADEYFDLDGRMLTAGDRQTLDNQYRAVTDSFFEEIEGELEIERIVEESRVTEAVGSPPPGTRAETRVQIAQRARNQIAGMDWDQINFKDGTIVMLESLEASDGMIAKAMSSGLFS